MKTARTYLQQMCMLGFFIIIINMHETSETAKDLSILSLPFTILCVRFRSFRSYISPTTATTTTCTSTPKRMEEHLNIPEAQREDINIQSKAKREATNIQRLNGAAERGDIDMFKNLIKEDPFILQRIDSVPYIHTPLHIAAAYDQTDFAMEILSWKSSFLSKFNLEGLSPIHVALKNGKENVALKLLDANLDQIPCVNRWRIVPIHYVAEQGNIDLLRRFLSASPQSIQDVTAKRETVLHIALKHEKLDTFRYLVRHLQTVQYEGAWKQETKILNWKDIEGNTILHIAARNNNHPQVVKLLINCGVNMNIKNSEGSTALDILDSGRVDYQKVKRMLVAAGATSKASSSAQVNVAINFEDDRFSTILSFKERVITSIVRFKRDIETDKRNALLVIVVLIATVTYQASLTPPGGVWQDSNSSSATQVHHHAAILRNMTLMALLLTISSTTPTANATFTKLFHRDASAVYSQHITTFYNIMVEIISCDDEDIDAE